MLFLCLPIRRSFHGVFFGNNIFLPVSAGKNKKQLRRCPPLQGPAAALSEAGYRPGDQELSVILSTRLYPRAVRKSSTSQRSAVRMIATGSLERQE